MNIEDEASVERMIDQYGLDLVLQSIREICYAKANHIAVEWQDVAQAKQWLAYGVRVNSVVQSLRLHPPSVRAQRGAFANHPQPRRKLEHG